MTLPLIVIVGHPNAGKSTLFNRLTGTRDALVADFPGVTRDLLLGNGRYGGRPHLVADTGGLPGQWQAGRAPLARAANRHTLRAAKDADFLLWLADGRAGPTSGDEELAHRLRRLGPPFCLAVNKTEGQAPARAVRDFYSLGCGAPQAISALHGNGVAQLMERALSGLRAPAKPAAAAADERRFRIAVIGRPNVGKSTLVNRILGRERMIAAAVPGTTRDSVSTDLDGLSLAGMRCSVTDTAGIRPYPKTTRLERLSIAKSLQTFADAQLVVLVATAEEGLVARDAKLLNLALRQGKRCVIAVNKWDRLPLPRQKRLRREIESRLVFAPRTEVRYISALYGNGMDGLFAAIERASASLCMDFPTSKLTRILREAAARHPPPMVRGRRIRLLYAHIGSRAPLRIVIHGRQVARIPWNYRRYLANLMTAELGLSGTPVGLEFRQSENPFVSFTAPEERPAAGKNTGRGERIAELSA